MKKLLGLLAITPMAVTACGSADPVAEVEVVREISIVYKMEEKTLVINDFVLEDADDTESYNKLGELISDKLLTNPIIGETTQIKIAGLLDGKEYTKETVIDTVVNSDGNATYFTSLLEVFNHGYTTDGELTINGVIAKHIKNAAGHIDSITPDQNIIDEFNKNLKTSLYSVKNASKYNELDYRNAFQRFEDEGGVMPDRIYTPEEFDKWFGIGLEKYNEILKPFENSYFKFTGAQKNWSSINIYFMYDRDHESSGLTSFYQSSTDNSLITEDEIYNILKS